MNVASYDEPAESFPQWLAQQTSNLDPDRAEAAKYVVERWPVTMTSADRTLRTLIAEDSEHVSGFRLLIEEYVDYFGLDPSKQIDVLRMVAPGVEVPREKCTECKREAVAGTGKCQRHGVGLMSEQERQLLVARVSERLVLASDRAVRVMLDLMDNARSEKVRGDMALALFDRIGAGPTTKIELNVSKSAEEAAEEVRGRLFKLRSVQDDRRAAEHDVVQGEAEVRDEEGA